MSSGEAIPKRSRSAPNQQLLRQLQERFRSLSYLLASVAVGAIVIFLGGLTGATIMVAAPVLLVISGVLFLVVGTVAISVVATYVLFTRGTVAILGAMSYGKPCHSSEIRALERLSREQLEQAGYMM